MDLDSLIHEWGSWLRWFLDWLIHWFICSVVGWFTAWFIGSMVGWFTIIHCKIGSLFHWPIGSLIRRFIHLLIFCFIGSLLHWLGDSTIHWLLIRNSLTHWFVDSLIHWFVESLIHCSVASLIHGFIDSLIHGPTTIHWCIASLPLFFWFTDFSFVHSWLMIHCSIHWFFAFFLHRFTDAFIGSWFNRLIGSLIDSSSRDVDSFTSFHWHLNDNLFSRWWTSQIFDTRGFLPGMQFTVPNADLQDYSIPPTNMNDI